MIDPEIITVSIYRKDKRKLRAIAIANDLRDLKNHPSIREAVRYVLMDIPDPKNPESGGGAVLPMKIYLFDTVDELILNSFEIVTRDDAQRLFYYWRKQMRERNHDIERLLIYGGTMRIMDPDEPITVPPRFPGQCLDLRVVYG